jgi:hypothetical protein
VISVRDDKTAPEVLIAQAKAKIENTSPGVKLGPVIQSAAETGVFSKFPEYISVLEQKTPPEVLMATVWCFACSAFFHSFFITHSLTLIVFRPTVVDVFVFCCEMCELQAKEKINNLKVGIKFGGIAESKFPEYVSIEEKPTPPEEKIARAKVLLSPFAIYRPPTHLSEICLLCIIL